MPESLGWLVANGKQDQIKKVLAHYHGQGYEENKFVKMQLAEMTYQAEVSGSDKIGLQ